jgi:hypothetical protein
MPKRTAKYVGAQLGFCYSDSGYQEQRIELQRGRWESGRGVSDFMMITLAICSDHPANVELGRTCRMAQRRVMELRAAGDSYARPQSLRKRSQVAALARYMAGELGWELTAAEEATITELEQDRTIDTATVAAQAA